MRRARRDACLVELDGPIEKEATLTTTSVEGETPRSAAAGTALDAQRSKMPTLPPVWASKWAKSVPPDAATPHGAAQTRGERTAPAQKVMFEQTVGSPRFKLG
jgi:hypothetical protein